MIETLHQFDVSLFLKIHRGLSNNFFDWLMPLLRNRFFWSPLYLFIGVYALRAFKNKGWFIIGGILYAFAVGDLLASKIIKPFWGRLRPCNDVTLSEYIIHRVPCGSGFSFPSAHATNHFAIAVFLILVLYKRWKGVLPVGLLWAGSISFAQVYVGVHFPIDILVGAMLGTIIGIFTFITFKRFYPEL